jgi:uncharacterized protein YdiU (UPF0061 family)
LSDSLLGLLQRTETDMTIFFRALASVELCGSGELDDGGWSVVLDGISGAWYRPADVSERLRGDYIAWFRLYRQLLGASGVSEQARREQMNGLNPKYVFRNYLAQLAIDRAEQGDVSLLWELLDVLRRPYEEQREKEHFAAKRPEWAREKAGCSMLSCSS